MAINDQHVGRTAATTTGDTSIRHGSPPQLRRILGIWDLILMIFGTVIGSGIFLVPGTVLRAVGNSVPLAITAWLAGGVLSLLGALTFGELSAMKPRAGGLYVYIRDCYGTFAAFLFGWTLFFVLASASIATLAVAFGNYLGELIPITPLGIKAAALSVIALIMFVNILGTRKSANVVNVTTGIKIAAILIFSTLLLWRGTHSLSSTISESGTGNLSGFGLAMISVLWAYEGWQYVTYSAGETAKPQRNFPLAFLIGSTGLMALYLLANLGYLSSLGATGAANSTRVAASALGAVAGPMAGKLVAVAILISMFSAANSLMLSAPRVCYAMANDGLFFKSLARIHVKYETPALAVLAAGIWSAVLAATGTFEQLLTYVVFTGWIFYALAAGSIFLYRRNAPNLERPYRVPGYPFTPILFLVAAAALVLNTIVTQPIRAGIGLAIVLLGAPAYLFWRRTASARIQHGS